MLGIANPIVFWTNFEDERAIEETSRNSATAEPTIDPLIRFTSEIGIGQGVLASKPTLEQDFASNPQVQVIQLNNLLLLTSCVITQEKVFF